MEVEAKFVIPDRAVFQRLVLVQRLAGYVLSPAQRKFVRDQYVETGDGAFLRGGFACRLRDDRHGGRLLTLKSLAPAQGLMHVRQELEVQLPPGVGMDMSDWPASEAASLARKLSDGHPLELLFELLQERHQRLVAAGEGQPALVELSIDITTLASAAPITLLGVEAELLPAGDRSTLHAIANELQQVWGLPPQPVSKFEWGLGLARLDRSR